MMRRPALARAFTALNRAVMSNDGRVGSELKRLIGHVASRVAGCRYCEAHTIRAAARFGAAEARDARRLDAVWSFRSSDLFDDAERAALEFACAAASVPGAVTPEIAAELRRHWDDGEIVEITGVVALFGFLNRWNDAMATELEAPPQPMASAGWPRRAGRAASTGAPPDGAEGDDPQAAAADRRHGPRGLRRPCAHAGAASVRDRGAHDGAAARLRAARAGRRPTTAACSSRAASATATSPTSGSTTSPAGCSTGSRSASPTSAGWHAPAAAPTA
jgi:uncharacterized peroxidase-related enzyme